MYGKIIEFYRIFDKWSFAIKLTEHILIKSPNNLLVIHVAGLSALSLEQGNWSVRDASSLVHNTFGVTVIQYGRDVMGEYNFPGKTYSSCQIIIFPIYLTLVLQSCLKQILTYTKHQSEISKDLVSALWTRFLNNLRSFKSLKHRSTCKKYAIDL